MNDLVLLWALFTVFVVIVLFIVTPTLILFVRFYYWSLVDLVETIRYWIIRKRRQAFVRRRLRKLALPRERSEMIWIGDGMAPAGPELIGLPVDFHGRKGKCVATSLLTITVEWEP